MIQYIYICIEFNRIIIVIEGPPRKIEKKRERETYPPARFRKWRNNLSERKEEKNRRPNGFTGRQKTIVGGREIILQREPAIRPGLRGGGGEGGRDKRTWNEQSAITICHAGKRCDAGRAVIKYKRCARRLRNSVALIMRFARHACERNGIRPFPDTFATYSHLLSDPYVLSLPLSLERLKSLQRWSFQGRRRRNIVGVENFNIFERISGKEIGFFFFRIDSIKEEFSLPLEEKKSRVFILVIAISPSFPSSRTRDYCENAGASDTNGGDREIA